MSLSASDISNMISAAANVVMAGGVIIAAKSFISQKKVHLIDVHTRFQATIRGLQDRMPPDINERLFLSKEEKRIIRLYWYAVFDEWITCDVRSNDKHLKELWTSFAWGAKSGIEHIPAFASEFVRFRAGKPYLLGTHDKFFKEVETFIRKNRSRDTRCIFLYGAPCSGKTSLANALKDQGWDFFKIDDAIKKFKIDPTAGDFSEFAEHISLELYRLSLWRDCEKDIVIELGCLFPQESSRHLQAMLELAGMNVESVLIEIDGHVARQRATTRNERIRAGHSDDFIIDDVENMEMFFRSLEDNHPKNAIILNGEASTAKNIELIFESIGRA